MPSASICAFKSFAMINDMVGPSDSTEGFVSSREAVAITVRFVFAFRSWIAIYLHRLHNHQIIKTPPASVSEI